MKLLPLLFLLSFCHSSQCQTYSTVIPDKEIIDFINQDIQRDSIKKEKAIIRKMIIPNKEDFFYTDSADYSAKSNELMSHFIFKKITRGNKIITNNLDTASFSKADMAFFRLQIEAISPGSSWKKSFKRSWLLDNPEYEDEDYHYIKNTVYYYSLPIFTLDKKRAIIIKMFNCGFLCGGSAYYLYQLRENNEWELLKTFNVLAE